MAGVVTGVGSRVQQLGLLAAGRGAPGPAGERSTGPRPPRRGRGGHSARPASRGHDWPPSRRSSPLRRRWPSAPRPGCRRAEDGRRVDRQSTMVDSTPTAHGPPSSTRSTSSPRSARTWSAVVGLTRPKRLADGAAMPPPSARSSCSASGWSGTRSPTVSWPPVTRRRRRRAPACEQHGERTGPARVGQQAGGGRHRDGPRLERSAAGEVHDQRMAGRAALDLGDPAHRRGRSTASAAEPVDGLGGDRHQPAGPHDRRAPAHRGSSGAVTRRHGVEEPEHRVDEGERLGRGEVVGVAGATVEPPVGQGRGQLSPGPAKSLSPMHDQHRAGDRARGARR